MTEDTRSPALPPFSAPALAEWTRHMESVLRGIAHALNNRAAAVAAVIELSTEPAEDPAVIRSILGTELERVQDLARVIRSLGTPPAGVEAFVPRDAVAEVRAVLDLHAGLRDRVFSIEADTAPPIRVPRWMFVRSLIALAGSLPAHHDRDHTRRVVIEENGEWLLAHADGSDAAGGIEPSALMSELAHAMGGEPMTDRGRYGFRVPTLTGLRRREGR